MRITRLTTLILILFTFLYQSCKSTRIEKNIKSENIHISNDSLISNYENKNNSFNEEDTFLNYIYHAEVSYLLALPNNIIEIATNKYDSTIYIYPDSSIFITTWVIYNYLTNYNYEINEYGDIAFEEIDTIKIYEHFNSISNNLIDEIVFSYNIENYELEKSRRYIKLTGICGKYLVSNKLLLCDVEGGTHAVVSLIIKYLPERKEIINKIYNKTTYY